MFDLKSYLKSRADEVNAALETYLPEDGDYMGNLGEVMRYSVFPGGKRFRPILALAACEALGLMPLPLENTEGPLPFYGSFYSRCPLLWQKADDFSWMLPEGVRLIAEEEEKEGLVDREGLKLRDRYAALLYGNHGTMELINDGVAEGTLFVIKDSYANILLPLLARHYHRVVAIDPRYFSGSAAEAVINCKGEAILCISGISSLASSRALALLD